MAQVFTNSIAGDRQFEPTKFGLPAGITGIDTNMNTTRRVRLAPAVTRAVLNAGDFILIPADAAKTIVVEDVLIVVSGAWTGLTDVRLSDTAASPIDVVTIAQANLTDAARFTNGSATGLTFGAGFCGALTTGAGLRLRKTGTTATAGTAFLVRIGYFLIS